MTPSFSERHAEDLVLRHRYLYYVETEPTLSDKDYDLMEKKLKALFPKNAVLNSVGSSCASDYPIYVREGRRPTKAEITEPSKGYWDDKPFKTTT